MRLGGVVLVSREALEEIDREDLAQFEVHPYPYPSSPPPSPRCPCPKGTVSEEKYGVYRYHMRGSWGPHNGPQTHFAPPRMPDAING